MSAACRHATASPSHATTTSMRGLGSMLALSRPLAAATASHATVLSSSCMALTQTRHQRAAAAAVPPLACEAMHAPCTSSRALPSWYPRPAGTLPAPQLPSIRCRRTFASSAPAGPAPMHAAASQVSGTGEVEEEPGVWRLLRPPHFGRSTDPSAGDGTSGEPLAGASWVPLLIDSPHSGSQYPPSFQPALERVDLQQTEDSYVHEMWAGAPGSSGAPLLCALFPRCFIDPNRPPDDIDPDLLDAPWESQELKINPGPKTKLGIGLIRRLASPGKPIYNRLLTAAEVLHRIHQYYLPYHRKLQQELGDMHNRCGSCFLLDAHSMKSVGNSTTPDGPGAKRPDVVVGDLDGTACAPWLTECLVYCLRDRQYTVQVNKPYKGAHILHVHGRPQDGRHAVQVEVNRSLYMDEATRVKHPAGFARLEKDLAAVAAEVAREIRGRVGQKLEQGLGGI